MGRPVLLRMERPGHSVLDQAARCGPHFAQRVAPPRANKESLQQTGARTMRSPWQRRCYGLAVAAAVLAAGCSGNANNGGQATHSADQAATATTLADLPQPSSRCGAPKVNATVLRFPAADGTQLDGVLVGSGPAGVVLLHQHPADL